MDLITEIREDNRENGILTIIKTKNTSIIATIQSNKCGFKLDKTNPATAAEVLAVITEAVQTHAHLEFELTKKMHQIVRDGTFMQRVMYLYLVGLKDEICRQDQFRDAENFHKFCKILRKNDIENYFISGFKTKRIIAVHPSYVEFDEEIREGLKVMPRKHANDYPVFVESEAALITALDNCLPGSTLVIDGHWVHQKKIRYGVWEPSIAEELAERIAFLVNTHPGKISHINLLGCESGVINKRLEGLICRSRLFFKYQDKPNSPEREMASQRNRAIYVCAAQESVFDPQSLAFKLISKLEDKSVAVTATPKLLYPWPPEDPSFNIGSDSENWKDKDQIWNESDNTDELCNLLGKVKSVTQINQENIELHAKRPWRFRI